MHKARSSRLDTAHVIMHTSEIMRDLEAMITFAGGSLSSFTRTVRQQQIATKKPADEHVCRLSVGQSSTKDWEYTTSLHHGRFFLFSTLDGRILQSRFLIDCQRSCDHGMAFPVPSLRCSLQIQPRGHFSDCPSRWSNPTFSARHALTIVGMLGILPVPFQKIHIYCRENGAGL